MAKYFVTFVLLTCVILESLSIHNRIFAKSEVSQHPHHHLRHQKHASIETSDHNAHHYRQKGEHHSRRHHSQHNHRQEEEQNEENDDAEHSPQSEELLRDAFIGKEYNSSSSLDWDPTERHYSPNLWHILRKEMSKTKPDNYVDALQGESNEDEAEMVRDDGFRGFSQFENDLDYRHDVVQKPPYKQTYSPPPQSLKCPKCESNSQNVRVSEQQLTQLRIEFVKKQILEKLRLKDKPNVSALGMPKPIYEETIQQDGSTSSKDLDDYYARTSKKFIFLEREKIECHHLSQPSVCFSFKIDDLDTESIDVSTAVLWIFKKRNRHDRLLNHTIVVSEVEQGGHNSKYLPKVKPMAIQTVDVQEGWVKIDIEWPIKRWFGIHDLSHLLHISCQSCEMDATESIISTEKDYRPFIMIDMQNRRRPSRQKRSVNCTDGVTECCRERLYISFDDIGWGDWIIQPKGYDAYFCRGSCATAASLTMSSTFHSSLLRRVKSYRESTGKKPLELIPCCTANQYSSLKIFYRESNTSATLKNLTNMIAESCGCV